jgi:hypothetical protein
MSVPGSVHSENVVFDAGTNRNSAKDHSEGPRDLAAHALNHLFEESGTD